MNSYRFNRPITALLVLLAPVLMPILALASGLVHAVSRTVDGYSDLPGAASYSIGQPAAAAAKRTRRLAFHASLGCYILGLFLVLVSKDAMVEAGRTAGRFYDNQVMYRLTAIIELALLPTVAVIMLLEREDVRDIYEHLSDAASDLVSVLRWGF